MLQLLIHLLVKMSYTETVIFFFGGGGAGRDVYLDRRLNHTF